MHTVSKPVHTDDTNELLTSAAGAGDEQRRRIEEQIAVRHLGLVHGLARRYAGRGADLDDLVQVGSLALIKAMRGFDASKGDFVPFARVTILGEIKRHFRDACWTIRPPRRVQEMQAAVSAATEHQLQSGHQQPRAADIAAEIGVTIGAIDEAMGANSYFSPSSLDQPAGKTGRTLADTLGREEPAYQLIEDWATALPWCRELSEDDRQLLTLRFVDDLTQQEIGDALGVSQMQISRRLRRVLDQLRCRADAELVA